MITHTPGASTPNFASEVLVALDELQAKVEDVTHLDNLVVAPHQDAVIVIGNGELHIRGYDVTSTAPIKDGETLLAGITKGTLSMPAAYREFRCGETGSDAVEGLRDYWVAILSGKREDDATTLLAWGYMPATTELESLGVDPLGLLDAIYERLELWYGVNFSHEARRKGFLDMLEKALTEVCRPIFTEDLSYNELRAFEGHIEIDSELGARGITRLIDMLATERPLSGELQDARRELAIIDLL